MDNPDLNKEVLDVRKVIEKSTSKVSLRDLEKKGFRQVKVLRAGDINQLIFKAVQNVLAKTPRGGSVMSDAEREQIAKDAKAELDQQMAAMREMQAEGQKLEARNAQIEQAHHALEAKLAEANQKLLAREHAINQEKAAFARDKQALYEKGLEGQQSQARNYEGQIADLRDRLARAESRAEGAIGRDEHEQALGRMKQRSGEIEQELTRSRSQTRRLEEEAAEVGRLKARLLELEEVEARAARLKRAADEAEEAEAKANRRANALQDDVVRLEGEVARLREEVASRPAAASSDGAEIQQLRMQMEMHAKAQAELINGLAGTLAQHQPVAAAPGESADLKKQFLSLQQALGDQLRKSLAGKKGQAGYVDESDLSPEAAAAIFAQQDAVQVETNIKDIAVKSTTAAGVKDKLSKLKNLRGK
jgi:chromosome segregation ATPase